MRNWNLLPIAHEYFPYCTLHGYSINFVLSSCMRAAASDTDYPVSDID